MEMILMRKVSLFKLLVLLGVCFLLSGCFLDDNQSGSNALNVAGTWRAPVQVTSCTPSNVCSQAGFEQGKTYNAVMNLNQNGSDVNGTYTYENSNINADVSGKISGSQLRLTGNVQNPFGRATVDFVGNVSNSVINATVSHNVSLFDGRTGTVGGSGDFTR
jgi:hypothetical protein